MRRSGRSPARYLVPRRYAPSLRGKPRRRGRRAARRGDPREVGPADVGATDLILTTYGMLARTDWMEAAGWRLVILDEAQAIKNSGTKQTRAVKRLSAGARVAMTGTPVENRLSDLWSLFDFL